MELDDRAAGVRERHGPKDGVTGGDDGRHDSDGFERPLHEPVEVGGHDDPDVTRLNQFGDGVVCTGWELLPRGTVIFVGLEKPPEQRHSLRRCLHDSGEQFRVIWLLAVPLEVPGGRILAALSCLDNGKLAD